MNDEDYMQQALKEARKAYDEDEVPIGAIVVINNKIISRGHNQTERLTDPTAHAEMIALTSAFNYIGSKYLPDATIYITVEPCLMCAGALYWSKIARVVYGAEDEKNGYRRMILPAAPSNAPNLTDPSNLSDHSGAPGSYNPPAAGFSLAGPWPFHPKTELVKGVLKEDCALLMKDFFRNKR